MKILARYVIALVLIVNFFVFCAVAQPQTKPNKKTPSGQVSGSVTIRGKPAVGLVVRMRASDSGSWSDSTLKATTNEEGKYHIGGIPPGTFLIAPIAAALVTSETGPYGQSGRTVVIAEDETVDEVDFTLVRGGVITGKVTDASGRPVIEEQVNLMPADQTSQRGVSYPFSTDDRGTLSAPGSIRERQRRRPAALFCDRRQRRRNVCAWQSASWVVLGFGSHWRS